MKKEKSINSLKFGIRKNSLLKFIISGVILSSLLISCGGEQGGNSSSQFNFEQVGYLKSETKNRIFVYLYQGDLSCQDVSTHGSKLINTPGQTTWTYYFEQGSNFPSDQISIESDFVKGQTIMEGYSDAYSFINVTKYNGENQTSYNGDEQISCG